MILKLIFQSQNPYLAKQAKAILQSKNIEAKVWQEGDIYIETNHLQEAALALEKELYNSLFLKGAKVVEKAIKKEIRDIPSSIGVCQNCVNEMLNPSSRRYYYPFTSCLCCSNQAAFLLKYPFERKNTLFAPFKICKKCQEELKSNPFRKNYPLISCSECNIPLLIHDKKKEFWANDKEEYKKIFEIAANALREGKSVALKTANGFKTFSLQPFKGAKLLIANASKAFEKLLLLPQEKKALFSIERPLMAITIADEKLREKIGAVGEIKAFDDGFTLLLCSELKEEAFIFYKEGKKSDLVMEYLLDPLQYEEMRFMINRNIYLLQGERAILPKPLKNAKCKVLEDLICYENLIDKKKHFEKVACEDVEKEDCATLKSVLLEHKIANEKALGFYFGENIAFYYFNGGCKEIFSFGEIPNEFESKISSYKEGYDKLIKRFFEKFKADIQKGDLWQRVANILGVEGGYEELRLLAMQFGKKGGVSVDCKIEKNRFAYEAFFASLMSYRLAGADNMLLSYSIFESLGEFAGTQLRSMGAEAKTNNFLLAGEYITNTPFLSRFLRHIPIPKCNIQYPVNRINALYGAAN